MAKVKLSGYLCERCGHKWLPRDKDNRPTVCPKCKSPYWNVQKKNVKQGKMIKIENK